LNENEKSGPAPFVSGIGRDPAFDAAVKRAEGRALEAEKPPPEMVPVAWENGYPTAWQPKDIAASSGPTQGED
jgi:hypothetical protein